MTTPVPSEARSDRNPEVDNDQPIRRPSLLRWLWYSYGGSLPAQHNSWVLHDVTCRSWWLRHFARWLMIILPVLALYLVLLPAPFPIRLYTGLTFAGGVLMFAWVNITIDTDRRAVRAGCPFSSPQRIRSAAAVDRQKAANYRRRERLAARRAGRRGDTG